MQEASKATLTVGDQVAILDYRNRRGKTFALFLYIVSTNYLRIDIIQLRFLRNAVQIPQARLLQSEVFRCSRILNYLVEPRLTTIYKFYFALIVQLAIVPSLLVKRPKYKLTTIAQDKNLLIYYTRSNQINLILTNDFISRSDITGSNQFRSLLDQQTQVTIEAIREYIVTIYRKLQ